MAEPTDKTPDPQQTERQKRIDQLTKKASEAEASTAALAQKNEALTQQLLALSQKIDNMSSAVPQATPPQPGPNTPVDLFGKPQSTENSPRNVNQSVDENTMRRIVQEAMQPFQQSLEQQAEDAELANQHKVAFTQAVATFPELGKQDSEAWEVFSQIWDNRPDLQKIADGPLFVAEAVRGITMSARTEEAKVDSDKRIASVTRPTDSGRIPLQSDTTKARDLKNQLVEKGERSGFDNTEMEDYLKLKIMEQSED